MQNLKEIYYSSNSDSLPNPDLLFLSAASFSKAGLKQCNGCLISSASQEQRRCHARHHNKRKKYWATLAALSTAAFSETPSKVCGEPRRRRRRTNEAKSGPAGGGKRATFFQRRFRCETALLRGEKIDFRLGPSVRGGGEAGWKQE